MDLSGPGGAEHPDDLRRRVAAHDRVVDDDQALAGDDLGDRVELQAQAVFAQLLARLDEGALMGYMKGWEIRVVDDPKDGRCVGIAIDLEDASVGRDERIYAVFSPAQARQLAQWLRIGAAPGRTAIQR